MKNQFITPSIFLWLFTLVLFSCNQREINNHENDGYDNPKERDLLEFEKTKDPALGYVPSGQLLEAIKTTENLKLTASARAQALNWIERGPVYDSTGPSNGNTRGGAGNPPGTYTSGRIRAVLVDPTDATGNTVFTGGITGGLWKTSNFLSIIPTWNNVNDFFDNMGITSICIDPSNSNIMYFSTGEATSNAGTVLGMGLWKSTDHGATWNNLPSTLSFTRTFKILCDNSGNLYAALRVGGIRRSNDGGNNWTNISPTGYTATSMPDFEISSTGTLHLSIGYGGSATYRYTNAPATENGSTWNTATGLPVSANRIEIATLGNIVYLCPTNGSNNVFGSYLSTDGGANFAVQSNAYTSGVSNGQGWYNISLDINPNDATQFIVGGLDAYRTVNSGRDISRLTYWVNSLPYVHADHHYVKWWNVGIETWILMATDGGLFLSRNNGLTFTDKNRGLGIKQFYSCDVHPTLTDYFLAGAQDNGSHKLFNAGLTYSIEVTGGDGAYVAIDQDQPQFQFTSYVYNQIRRSTNSGANWSSFDITGTSGPGLFINPFDYDDVSNKIFSCYGSSMMRWNNATTAANLATIDTSLLSIPGSTGNLTAFTVSPHTPNLLFVGTSTGRLFKINNSNTTTSSDIGSNTTNITGPSFTGYLNSIAIGSTDQHLLAIFSNYGVTNVWYSANGGSTWTGIDGDLPNMPVRWAVFDPSNNNKVIIATEAGVYATDLVNGASTQWLPSPNFPTVRTDMLKVRNSDKLIVAATHGRGLWSSYILSTVPVKEINLQARLDAAGNALLNWSSLGAVSSTKFTIQFSLNGISFSEIVTVGNKVSGFKHALSAPVGYYRIVSAEQGLAPVYSNVVIVRTNKLIAGLKLNISPNPVFTQGNFIISSTEKGEYNWMLTDFMGRVVQKGKGNLTAGSSLNLPVNVASLSKGSYHLLLMQNQQKIQSTFIKQ